MPLKGVLSPRVPRRRNLPRVPCHAGPHGEAPESLRRQKEQAARPTWSLLSLFSPGMNGHWQGRGGKSEQC